MAARCAHGAPRALETGHRARRRRKAAAAAAAAAGGGAAAARGALLAAALTLGGGVAPGAALAGPKVVGEFAGQGLLIKDTIQVIRVDDPSVEGVTVYLSQSNESFKISQSNNTALGCAITGPVVFTGDLGGKAGEEIVREGRGIFSTKAVHVRRVYDKERQTLTYISYNTRLAGEDSNKSRFKTALCTVPLYREAPPVVAAAAE